MKKYKVFKENWDKHIVKKAFDGFEKEAIEMSKLKDNSGPKVKAFRALSKKILSFLSYQVGEVSPSKAYDDLNEMKKLTTNPTILYIIEQYKKDLRHDIRIQGK